MQRDAGNDSRTVHEFVRAYRRLALLVCLVAVLAGGSAFVVASLQTKMYEATARLVYGPLLDPANPDVQAYTLPAVLQTELKSVARSVQRQQAQGYVERLVVKADPNHAPYTLSVDTVIKTASNSWAALSARSRDPKVAMAAANAGARSFLAYRRTVELAQVEAELKYEQLQLSEYPTSAKTSDTYVSMLKVVNDLAARRGLLRKGGSSFRVAAPAVLPQTPYAPRPVATAFLTFLAVLAGGVGVLFLLGQRDYLLRDTAAVRSVLAFPLIGSVQRASEKTADVTGYSFATAQEALDATQARLEFLLGDREVKSLGVGGSEETDGAGLLACDLAVAMAVSGKRVGLIDGTPGRSLVSQCFELPNDLGVTSVVVDEVALTDAVHTVGLQSAGKRGPDAGGSGDGSLAVLCGGPESSDQGLIITSRRFASLIRQFGQDRDVVIVATPSLAEGDEAAAVAAAVDGLVVVVDVTAARRRSLQAVQSQIKAMECNVLGVVIMSEEVRPRADRAGIAEVADDATAQDIAAEATVAESRGSTEASGVDEEKEASPSSTSAGGSKA